MSTISALDSGAPPKQKMDSAEEVRGRTGSCPQEKNLR